MNIKAVPDLTYNLTSWRIFEVSGPDASRYLQGRLSQDINSLNPRELKQSLMLSPQGKVQQMPLITSLDKDKTRFYLICYFNDEKEVETFKEELFKFKVADQVELEVKDLNLCFSEKINLELEKNDIFNLEDGIGFFFLSNKSLEIKLESEELFNKKLTSLGKPLFYRDIKSLSPAGLLELKDYVSFTKGCYAGQEVVEKTDALGKAAKKIYRLVSESSAHELMPGEEVFLEKTNKKIGEITSFSLENNKSYALSVLKTKELEELDPLLKIKSENWKIIG